MEKGRFHPTGNWLAPRQAGIHFVKNPALSLQANRTIVPLSKVDDQGLDAVNEAHAAKLPSVDTGRLIAFDDANLESPQDASVERMKERTIALLAGFSGMVVISPPHCDDEQLLAIVTAVHEACEKMSKLSVTFAVDNGVQRERLTQAYGRLRNDLTNQRELDIDDDDFVIAEDLWKSV